VIARLRFWLGLILDAWAERLRAPYYEELVHQRLLGAVFASGKVVYPKVTRRQAVDGIHSATIYALGGDDMIVALVERGKRMSDAVGLPLTPNGGDVILYSTNLRRHNRTTA